MEFMVKFVGKPRYAICRESRGVGLNFLDRVRRELGIPHLSPERVAGYTGERWKDPRIVLTEEEAREAGCFEDTCEAKVKVPDEYLNRYTYISYKVKKNDETGEVQKVTPYWELNKESLIKDWIDEGAPLEWGFDEEKEEEEV